MAKIKQIAVRVQVAFIREGKYIVAYAPALELSSYGKTQIQAQQAFAGAMKVFLDETERKGTLERILLKLGWNLAMDKYEPPHYDSKELLGMCRGNSLNEIKNTTFRIPLPV